MIDDFDEEMKHCAIEELSKEEFPLESAHGFNLIFSYAMLKEGPFDDYVETIKNILQTVEGIEKIQVAAEPVDGNLVKYQFS